MKRVVGLLVVVVVLAGQVAIAQTTAPSDAQKSEAAKKFQDRVLQRVQLLNNLKQRYQFKLRDLQQELRDKAIKLSIDGMGVPGRLSIREQTLSDLLKRQVALDSDLASAKGKLERMEKDKTKVDEKILERLDRDPRILGYVQQIDEIDLKLADGVGAEADVKRLERRKAALEEKSKKRREEIINSYSQAQVEALKETVVVTQKELARVNDEIAAAKQDMGDLTYQLSQYMAAKDEEKAVRELRDQVNQQLDKLAVLSDLGELQGEVNWKEFDRELFRAN